MFWSSRPASLAVSFLLVVVAAIVIPQSITAQGSQNVGDIVKNSPLTTENDKKTIFGGCDSDPFPYLEARHKPYDRSNSFVTPRETSGNSAKIGLDSALACRLKKLFEAFEASGCKITIVSAMRPDQKCRAGPGCAPQGASCHQYGKAVDVSSTCQARLAQFLGVKTSSSQGARQFGLHFGYQVGALPNHIQCVEHARAACNRQTPPCPGGIQITGDPDSVTRQGPPSSNLTNNLRSALTPQPPPLFQQAPMQQPATPAPPIGTQNTTPYTPGTCSPQFYCQNNNLYYRTSSCVDQVSQVCPDGCEAGSCKGGRQGVSDLLGSALSDIGKPDATSTDKKSTSSLSAFDQISIIANPNVEQKPTTTDPFILTIDGNSATRLQVPPPPGSLAPPGETYALIPPGQQTFTSGDLMESPYMNRPVSGIQGTLASIRAQLEHIVAYLRPFGRPIPEGEHEHFE